MYPDYAWEPKGVANCAWHILIMLKAHRDVVCACCTRVFVGHPEVWLSVSDVP